MSLENKYLMKSVNLYRYFFEAYLFMLKDTMGDELMKNNGFSEKSICLFNDLLNSVVADVGHLDCDEYLYDVVLEFGKNL